MLLVNAIFVIMQILCQPNAERELAYAMLRRSQDYTNLVPAECRAGAITSRSLNLGTTPGRGIFPLSLTKSFARYLHTSRILTKFANKLCIAVILVVFIFTTKLLKISNMHNFS